MKKNLKFILAAAAAIAMIGCAKDEGPKVDNPNQKGAETTASFNISFKGNATRTMPNGSDAATPGESTFVDAWVFLFDDATKTLETKVKLAVTGNTASKTGVKTTTGKHYIYVVVNGADLFGFKEDNTDDFKVADAENQTPGMTMAAFLGKTIDVKTTMPTTAGKFLMTGYSEAAFVAPSIENPDPEVNKVNMGVGRAVAKVHMQDAHTSDPENAVVSNMAYKVMNNPATVYAFQQYEMKNVSGSIVNSGVIRNYIVGEGDEAVRTDRYFRLPSNTAKADYKAASNTSQDGLYVPENWNTNPVPSTHNATSLVIQGSVLLDPSIKLRDTDGVEGASHTADADFYRVWDKTAKKWLPFFFSASPSLSTIKAAAGLAVDANAATSDNKITQDNDGVSEFFIAHYEDAKAYWRLPLNKDEKSVVARNDYFWVTIKTIAEIGASTDSDDPDEDGVIPGKDPEPLDKTEVDIKADIELLKWNGIDQEGNI